MNYYALIPLTAFVINFFTLTYILALKRHSAVNRAYLLFAGDLALLSLGSFIIWSLDPGPWVLTILRLASIVWIMMGFFFLNFTYAFLQKQRDGLYYASFVISSVFYMASVSTDLIISDYTQHYWGYYETMGPLCRIAGLAVFFFPFLYALRLLYTQRRQARDINTKRQISHILTGTGGFLMVAVLSDLISLQLFEIYHFFTLSTTGTVLQSLFIFRAVTKYNFLSIGVEEVSHDLFMNLEDGIILLDTKGSIIQMNESAKSLFNLKVSENNVDISMLFDNYNLDSNYRNYETSIRLYDIPTVVSLSQATVKQYDVELGKLLIVRDITEDKRSEDALRQSKMDLEKLAGQLAEVNTSLERMVAERTRTLEETNAQLRQQIAKRERAEADRQVEQEHLMVTLSSIGDGVITIDTAGRVVLLNKVASEFTGWPSSRAVGQPLRSVFRLLDERTQTAHESAVEEALQRNLIINRARPRLLLSHDGTERLVAESGAPIRAQDGSVIGAVLVFRDMTEQRKIEEELIKADRLESVGMLAGGIAHDFNNILTAILGNVSLAKMYASADEKLSSRLDKAEMAALRARDLTQQLLTFAKGETLVKRLASIKELIQEAVDFSLRGANVRCDLYMADDLWSADVDTGQISQVVHNLVINANQAMPDGGILEVRAENQCIEIGSPEYLVSLKPGHYVKITIKDQGHGIEEDRLQKIFDPYVTSKKRGNGLGLFTSYSIIKQHEGYIDVKSTVGVGTTFSVYLPASDKTALPAAPAPSSLAAGSGKILVMEDEETLRDVIGGILHHFGYDVDFAHDGHEAIAAYEQAKSASKPFDAIIMDLTIPGGMGGKETMGKMLAIDPSVKAIVASGYANDPIMSAFRQYGFQGCIAKPYEPNALHRVLRDVIAGKADCVP